MHGIFRSLYPKLCLIFIVHCMSLVNVSLPLSMTSTNRIQNTNILTSQKVPSLSYQVNLSHSPLLWSQLSSVTVALHAIWFLTNVQNTVIVIDSSVHHCLWVIFYHMQFQFTVILLHQFIVWPCGSLHTHFTYLQTFEPFLDSKYYDNNIARIYFIHAFIGIL